jgi:hypothetical protein
METLFIGLVEKYHKIARILLELLIDEYSVDEEGGIRELLTIAAVNGVDEGVEPWEFT